LHGGDELGELHLGADNGLDYLRQRLIPAEARWEKSTTAEALGRFLNLSRGMFLGWDGAGDGVAQAAIAALIARAPMSFNRMGDGEGNILGILEPGSDAEHELAWFNAMFSRQTGVVLDLQSALGVARDLETALTSANILGVRTLTPWSTENWPYATPTEIIRNSIADENLRGAHGLLCAETAFDRWLADATLKHTILTHAWAYLSILPHLPAMIAAADRVVLISGRPSVHEALVRRNPGKPIDLLKIPLEPENRRHKTHYPELYRRILEQLSGDLAGCLVLAGAGLLGKAYVHKAARCGAVALDLGSGFDLLAGVRSRPVHRQFDLARFSIV
jgi:hypothetical protein